MIFKILSIISAIGALFLIGSNSGKNKQKNKRLKKDYNELQKDIKISRKANSMSFSDKSNFLLRKQRNNNK